MPTSKKGQMTLEKSSDIWERPQSRVIWVGILIYNVHSQGTQAMEYAPIMSIKSEGKYDHHYIRNINPSNKMGY